MKYEKPYYYKNVATSELRKPEDKQGFQYYYTKITNYLSNILSKYLDN